MLPKNQKPRGLIRVAIQLSCVLLAAQFVVAQEIARPPNISGPKFEPKCELGDKVDATLLAVGPNVAAFLSGTELQFSMTIRNKCPSGTAGLRVPWRFYKGTEVLGSGRTTVKAGEQSIVTFRWTAVKGQHEIMGAANVPYEFEEDDAAVDNNKVRRTIQVEAVPAPVIVAPTITNVGPKFKVSYTVCNAVRDAWYTPSCSNDQGLGGCRAGFAVNVSEGNAAKGAFSIDGEGFNPSCPDSHAFSAGVRPGVLLPDGTLGMDGDRPVCGAPAKYTLKVEATRDGETLSTSRTFLVSAVLSECPPKPSDLPKP